LLAARRVLFIGASAAPGKLLSWRQFGVRTTTDIAPSFQILHVTTTLHNKTHKLNHRPEVFQQPMCGGIGILDYDVRRPDDLFFTHGAKLPELRRRPVLSTLLLRTRGDGTSKT